MNMTKKVVNVTVFTVIALVALMAFGYTFKVFREINAMDLGSLSADHLGKAATDMVEDESKADAAEITEVKNAETVIGNCMDDGNVISSVRADYANHRMVYLMLTDGACVAAESGNADEWNKVCDLGRTVSLDGQKILEESGLCGWSFEVEVLNDSYPANALLTFENGECTYDCMK